MALDPSILNAVLSLPLITPPLGAPQPVKAVFSDPSTAGQPVANQPGQAAAVGGGAITVEGAAPTKADAQRWRVVEIPIVARDIKDADGQPIPLNVGSGNLYQWCDPLLADAWKFEARRLVNDAARRTRLNAPIDRNNTSLKYAQLLYVHEICRALAEYYNACNVVWWNDPVARRLYRKWIAGAPDKVGEDSLPAQFAQKTPYAKWQQDGRERVWWDSNEEYPFAWDNRGLLVKQARASFMRWYPRPQDAPKHPLKFVQTCGLWVSPTDAGTSYLSAQAVRNRPFSLMGFAASCGMRTQDVQGYKRDILVKCEPTQFNKTIDGNGREAPKPAWSPGHPAGDGWIWDDWRSTYFDEEPDLASNEYNTTSPLKVTAPLQAYLGWLTEWVNALGGRPPQATVLDSRIFVAWCNLKSAERNGGVESYLRTLGAQPADIAQARNATDPGLQAAAAAVAAVGAASAPVTAGWGAIIGGVAAAGIVFADMVTPGNVRDFQKDDLGRFKPVIERAQCGGDATLRDYKPPFPVPAPTSFVRPQDDIDRANRPPPNASVLDGASQNAGGPGNPPPVQAPSEISPAVLAAGGIGLAAIFYLLARK